MILAGIQGWGQNELSLDEKGDVLKRTNGDLSWMWRLMLCSIASSLGFSANACIVSYNPIQAENYAEIFDGAQRFDTVSLSCVEDCVPDRPNVVILKSLDGLRDYEIRAAIVEKEIQNIDFVNRYWFPWSSWTQIDGLCSRVPSISADALYDIAVQDSTVVWLDDHNPILRSLVLDNSEHPEVNSEFVQVLPWLMASSAVVWKCHAGSGRFETHQNSSNKMDILGDFKFRPLEQYKCSKNDTIGMSISDEVFGLILTWSYSPSSEWLSGPGLEYGELADDLSAALIGFFSSIE